HPPVVSRAQELSNHLYLAECRAWPPEGARRGGAHLSAAPNGAAATPLVAVCLLACGWSCGAGPPTLPAPLWHRKWLQVDGASAGAHYLAQSGAAIPADGCGSADCEYVDSLALAVLAAAGAGPRRVARWHFRLDRMRSFLRRAIERFYGAI